VVWYVLCVLYCRELRDLCVLSGGFIGFIGLLVYWFIDVLLMYW